MISNQSLALAVRSSLRGRPPHCETWDAPHLGLEVPGDQAGCLGLHDAEWTTENELHAQIIHLHSGPLRDDVSNPFSGLTDPFLSVVGPPAKVVRRIENLGTQPVRRCTATSRRLL
jgi:hypothetical protein